MNENKEVPKHPFMNFKGTIEEYEEEQRRLEAIGCGDLLYIVR